jgi:alpha-glucosidase
MLLTAFAGTSLAADYTVSSPDGSIVVTINESPTFQFMVTKDGKTTVKWSPLGVKTSSMDFTQGLSFISKEETSVDEKYPMIHGTKSEHVNHYNELALTLKNGADNQLTLRVRAFDEGAAFRYEIAGSGNATVTAEATTFTLTSGCSAWLGDWDTNMEYQGMWRVNNNPSNAAIEFPALIRTPDSIYVQITEAAVYGDFCASHLTASATAYKVVFGESQVAVSLPLTMPWRVMVIGSLKNIVENSRQTVDNLNPPCEIDDVSWIQSGNASWSWLAYLTVKDYAQQKTFIDFSKEMGWPFCTVDEGWRNSNMDQLHTYAESQGIKLITWYAFNEIQNATSMENIMNQCVSYGISGMKVDFTQSDSKLRMQWFDDIIKAAISKKLMIFFHGCTLPRGNERRWPNVMTYEAIKGAEQYLGGASAIPLTHNCIVPFTRNAVGPMDYTPVVYSKSRQTTKAHELAQTVVYQSGIQHFGDKPEAYTALTPSPLPFMKAVPASWDDVRFISGSPSEYICIARRKGNDWFIAGLNGTTNRTASLDLSFLKPGTYTVDLYSDLQVNSQEMKMTSTTLTAPGNKNVVMVKGGGFCMRIPDSYQQPVGIIATPQTKGALNRKSTLSILPGASGYLVTAEGHAIDKLAIFNCQGKVVAQVRQAGSRYELSAKRLQPGMYVVQATVGGQQLARQFMHK